MNISLLEKKMNETKISAKELSAILGINESTFYRKKKRAEDGFNIAEAQKIAQILKLSPNEATDIFFSH